MSNVIAGANSGKISSGGGNNKSGNGGSPFFLTTQDPHDEAVPLPGSPDDSITHPNDIGTNIIITLDNVVSNDTQNRVALVQDFLDKPVLRQHYLANETAPGTAALSATS